MLSVSDIIRLRKYFSKNCVEDISSKIYFEFMSDKCKDYKLSLEHGGSTEKVHYACWQVFLKKKRPDGTFESIALPEVSYHSEYPDLPLSDWYVSNQDQSAIMQTLARISHDQDTESRALRSCWCEAGPPEKPSLTLYRVVLYDQMKGEGWVYAKDPDHAYEIARECEENGLLIADDFVSSDIEVFDEYNPDSIDVDWILNIEDTYGRNTD